MQMDRHMQTNAKQMYLTSYLHIMPKLNAKTLIQHTRNRVSDSDALRQLVKHHFSLNPWLTLVAVL